MKRFIPIPVILACMAFHVHAQVILVPSEQPTIQAAIDAAVDGDTVLVAEGTYFENILFKGRAITLASLFILDGDTSHISKTIIDGSQATIPDTASTVAFLNGEDTTSVLMGFTITGGSGSILDRGWIELYGGGIVLYDAGGKICHNHIIENHLQSDTLNTYGAGIGGLVNPSNALIIRNNRITNNTATSGMSFGGGVYHEGGFLLVEENSITHNSLFSEGHNGGAGIWCAGHVIRNNFIDSNTTSSGLGGGIVVQGSGDPPVEIYNNIISNNSVGKTGGGIYTNTRAVICNNTIYNNAANAGGSSLLVSSAEVLVYNNILWSGIPDDMNNLAFKDEWGSCKMLLNNNILSFPTQSDFIVSRGGNLDMDPAFVNDSMMLSESSPAIGRGIDSLEFLRWGWFHAPSGDYAGNTRPGGLDERVDIGAYESHFEPVLLASADLEHVGLWDRRMVPEFDPDTVEYVILLTDTTMVVPEIDYGVKDFLAQAEVEDASDLMTEDKADRTTTITVTSSDSSQTKEYVLLFEFETKDATLDTLYFSEGILEPEFEPATTRYTCILCAKGEEVKVPKAYFHTTSPFASVKVYDASDVEKRTSIIVTADDDIRRKTYYIDFLVVDTCVNDVKDWSTVNPQIYPNPFLEHCTIEVPNNKSISRIEIMSLDGRIVRVLENILKSSITIDRDGLPSGFYVLRIHADEIYTTKVLVE